MPLVAHSPAHGEAVAYPARPREVRICATPGCGTHLRRGHGPYCSLHERPVERKKTGRGFAVESHEVTCLCGAVFTTTNVRRLYCSDACRMRAY